MTGDGTSVRAARADRRVLAARGPVKVGGFPRDDTHEVLLQTSDRTMLRLLVVPPLFSEAQGSDALLAAATTASGLGGTELLREVLDSPAVDPADQWGDDGGSWWSPDLPALPVRAGT